MGFLLCILLCCLFFQKPILFSLFSVPEGKHILQFGRSRTSSQYLELNIEGSEVNKMAAQPAQQASK